MEEDLLVDGQLNLVKENIVSTILSDQHLLKYLKYKNNAIDVPKQKDLTLDEIIGLKNKNIYEYRKAPSPESPERDVWISMEYGVIQRMNISSSQKGRGNPSFIKPTFYFYIITIDELDKCLNGSRLYAIEDRLVHLFNNKNNASVGNTFIVRSEPMQLPYPYVGRMVTMGFYDKNDGVAYG